MDETAEIEQRLRRAGAAADSEIDIGRAALDLAALDRPGVAPDRYHDFLHDLVADTRSLAPAEAPAGARLAALNRVIVQRHGFVGDSLTYDDAENANLMRVIDRRKGLPVALGVLYLHAGRAQGWDIAGLNFPAHFLLRLQAGGERLVIDPFNGGRQLDAADMRGLLRRMTGGAMELSPDLVRDVGPRDVLLRLQNNIKTRAVQAGDLARAGEVLRRMLLIAPGAATLWRELGGVELRAGNLGAAIAAFESVLELADDPRLRHAAVAALQDLRRRLN